MMDGILQKTVPFVNEYRKRLSPSPNKNAAVCNYDTPSLFLWAHGNIL